MDKEKYCFAAIDFVDDPNVSGYAYWYACEFIDVAVGDRVVAPLGRHNNLQEGIVRRVLFETRKNSPYRFDGIKYIKAILKDTGAINVQNS